LTEPSTFDCRTLDYGIYWYGPGHTAQKAVAGTQSAFFDPHKPTVIYTHGWQRGSIKSRQREDYRFDNVDNGQKKLLSDAWLAAGWNIGIFYWNQFADEEDVRNAETKIWSKSDPTTDPVGIRWRQCDDTYSTTGSPNESIGEIFLEAYRTAMAGYKGSNVRLVGHSLGNQLVTRLAGLIADGVKSGGLPPNLLPTRVALLDSWWSMAPAPGTKFPPPAPPGKTSTMPPLVRWHAPAATAIIRNLIAEGMIAVCGGRIEVESRTTAKAPSNPGTRVRIFLALQKPASTPTPLNDVA
jgi:pimeloyl-ACP methyl ester carboxylesterase